MATTQDGVPPPKILIIIGSVRATRRNPVITKWVQSIVQSKSSHNYELIDLKDWQLPFDDEPGIPAGGTQVYTQPHTKTWSEKVASAQGYIFVSPQYNRGYPAVLKNAIDHLFTEWKGKPAGLVTYGGHGGTASAAQLKQIFEGVGLKILETSPALVLRKEVVYGAELNPEVDFEKYVGDVEKLAEQLNAALEEVAAEQTQVAN